jgi:hypothetical protein
MEHRSLGATPPQPDYAEMNALPPEQRKAWRDEHVIKPLVA